MCACIYIKKMCKIYIVWGQYLSKHICLILWVQFTEMKWPAPVVILPLQHLSMLRELRHLAPCEVWPTLCCMGVGGSTGERLLRFESGAEMTWFGGR